MIGRRSLITAVLGAIGAGASGVTASDVIKSAAGLDAPLPDKPYPSSLGDVACENEPSSWWQASSSLRDALHHEEMRLERSMYQALPPNIAAMRSWSAVVKRGTVEKRQREIRRALRALDEERTATALMRKLGLLP